MRSILLLLLFVSIAFAEKCQEQERRPTGCRSYEECNGGVYTAKVCPRGEIFNKEKKRCIPGDCRLAGLASSFIKSKECNVSEGDLKDCTKYYACEDGVLSETESDCWSGLMFDCEKRICLPPGEGKCCGCKEGEKEAVVGDCRKYRVCVNGKFEREEKCWWPKKFDPVAKECFWFNVNCDQKREKECNEGWTAPDPSDCKKFWKCHRGVKVKDECGWLRVFDPEKGCHYGSCPTSSFKSVEVCSNNERRANPDNCQKYFVCKGGKMAEEECLFGRYYDSVKGICVEKEKAKCGGATPTPKPEVKCSGKASRSVVGRCDQYDECVNGILQRQTCPFGQRFDALSSKCVPFARAKCNTQQCSIEGERIPAPGCQSYYECESSKLVLKNCWFYQRFDSVTKECVTPFWKGTCGGTTIPGDCLDGDTRAVLGNCKAYLKCNKNTWVPEKCGVFHAYDALKKSCEWEGKVDCLARERYFMAIKETPEKDVTEEEEKRLWDTILAQDPVTTTPAPTPTPACKEDSRTPVDGECKSYLHCVKGALVKKTCPTCQNFNPAISRCVYTWKFPCWDHPTTPTPPPTPPPTPSPTPTPSNTPTPPPTKTDPPPPTPGCKNGEKIPDKTDCHYYLECQNGKMVRVKCTWLRHFDSVSKSCAAFSYTCAK